MEIEEEKRNFIIASQTMPGQEPKFHMFEDVSVFKKGSGYCFTCGCTHSSALPVSLLFAGPSCKNLSKMFTDRNDFADCYNSGEGCSGHTYLHGVLQAAIVTNPAVLFFENVLGVSESATVRGKKVDPPIKASWKG